MVDYTVTVGAHNSFRAWWESLIYEHTSSKNYRVFSSFTRLEDTASPEFELAISSVIGDEFELLAQDTDYEKLDDNLDRFSFQNRIFRDKANTMVVHFITAGEENATVQIYVDKDHVEDAKKLIDGLDESLPRMPDEPEDDNIVFFKFWHLSPDGPVGHTKELLCPSIKDIEDNYTPVIQNMLYKLADMRKPDNNGKIVLWQGEPGTGKTYAVRALARAWSQKIKASIEVVLDPERLLGNSDYMYSLLLSGSNRQNERRRNRAGKKPRRYPSVSHMIEDMDDDDYDDDTPIRLIIIEDHAELFANNCRDTPGFSRFLNLTDGIIGQGVRTVFLLTANEEIEVIDPAVLRPGRCLAVNTFDKLKTKQAQAWLASRGSDTELTNAEYSLADLYVILNKKPEDEGSDLPTVSDPKLEDISNYNETKDFGF